tara:strand:- start:139 stop:594 length:456 start_codon:yes stop_codon:yes gene_type:complete
MVDPVDNLIKSFAESGASYISFHPEASREVEKSLNLIKESKCNTGLVLNPNSPLSLLDDHWDNLDMVLLMSVNPGFAGQDFISSVLKKITSLREIIDRTGLDIRLEVDGGIKLSNIAEISKAGADTFVAGSAIFNEDNYEQVISEMRDSLD